MDEGCTREQIEEKKKGPNYRNKPKYEYFGDEIYVKVSPEYGSIYVPFIALKERNPEIIIKRHSQYHNSYYAGAGREEVGTKALYWI